MSDQLDDYTAGDLKLSDSGVLALERIAALERQLAEAKANKVALEKEMYILQLERDSLRAQRQAAEAQIAHIDAAWMENEGVDEQGHLRPTAERLFKDNVQLRAALAEANLQRQREQATNKFLATRLNNYEAAINRAAELEKERDSLREQLAAVQAELAIYKPSTGPDSITTGGSYGGR